MKITSLGTSPLMTKGLLSGFEQLGYETSNFPCRSWMLMDENDGLYFLENDLKESKCDLLIFGGNYPPYFLELKNLCKKYGCKYLYWAIEDPPCFKINLPMCNIADFVFTTTYEKIEEYKKHGIKAYLLLFACNPEYHKIGSFDYNLNLDCALQASYYIWESRQIGFNSILDGAFESTSNIAIWGAGWNGENGQNRLGNYKKYFRGYLVNHKLPDLCYSSKIILGVQCDNSDHKFATQTAMRPFEVLSCGGFHLTQYTNGTNNIFENFKHLVMSNNKEETKELIKYYLNNENERNKIRWNGYQFVRNYHTYKQRVKYDILPIVKG